MTDPPITVLLPVYNGERFLREAVESILSQTFRDFEFLIINDGSTDASGAILREYASKDSRIILVEQENRGLVATLNRGMQLAHAPLIARMDADDISLPDRLRMQKEYLDVHPEIAVLGSNVIIIDEHGKQNETWICPRYGQEMDSTIPRGSPVAHPAVMMRRDVVISIGGYRRAYRRAQDYDLWLRLHKIVGIDNLPEILLQLRKHKDNISFKYALEQDFTAIIARLAAKADKDPTEQLDHLSLDTLQLFCNPSNTCSMEFCDDIANAMVIQPHIPILDKVLQLMPNCMRPETRSLASTIYAKYAYAYLKRGSIVKTIFCIYQSFLLAPTILIRLIFQTILKLPKLLRRVYKRILKNFLSND